ncbi:hypothetical protein BD410DRAFT_788220 [Rickenella mellea]|uniref:Uncharacterized protein n=1 Tax=Rickenella mellea TaxID=50990 RepID=A0A4Y7Q6B0_9AGAM|nr:hypothetical protein BD410DRAFT_788220 [Rickenella mellea]
MMDLVALSLAVYVSLWVQPSFGTTLLSLLSLVRLESTKVANLTYGQPCFPITGVNDRDTRLVHW